MAGQVAESGSVDRRLPLIERISDNLSGPLELRTLLARKVAETSSTRVDLRLNFKGLIFVRLFVRGSWILLAVVALGPGAALAGKPAETGTASSWLGL